jgi:hypothetical protein
VRTTKNLSSFKITKTKTLTQISKSKYVMLKSQDQQWVVVISSECLIS